MRWRVAAVLTERRRGNVRAEEAPEGGSATESTSATGSLAISGLSRRRTERGKEGMRKEEYKWRRKSAEDFFCLE